ncbi:membrane protein [Spirochaetia bacterium]|nr:membrane protein [Spirochaetia bacterium]
MKRQRLWLVPAVVLFMVMTLGAEGTRAVVVDRDLVIPISEVSPTAQFYPVEIEGVRMEVIAVQAADGTIRTAFNTCQVCYSSGRGYYKQEGNALVCQNCGNRFRMNRVEVASGGCNPVPIFAENKTVTRTTITISRAFLREAKTIFARWKSS